MRPLHQHPLWMSHPMRGKWLRCREDGVEQGEMGVKKKKKRKEKSFWWIMLLVGQPCNNFGQESNSPRFSVTAAILLFLSAPFVIPGVHWLWQQCQRWYLMIPLAGTNYYQWLKRETWLLTHILSFAWGKLLNYPCQINDEQRCMDPGCIMGS